MPVTTLKTNLNEIWDKVLSQIQKKITDKNLYNSVFADLKLVSLEKNEAVILANTTLAKALIDKDYRPIISESITNILETVYQIRIVCQSDLTASSPTTDTSAANKNAFFKYSSLNPNLTFDNFVVGKSNLQAYQAATYVADKMGSFNPLFIYSKSGLGKTHLLNAIGNSVREKNPLKKILMITADDFVAEFVQYVKGDQDGENLKDFFRTIDYLLIDDIQFMANKPQTCTMFFHIFNQLFSSGKQIVLTSDRPPAELDGLEDRLVSRFSSGISISIDPPEKNTLIEILKYKIKANGFDVTMIDDDALEYIATKNSSNVRVLEGALNRVMFINVTMGNCNRITKEICMRALEGDTKKTNTKGKLTPEKIINTVASYYNIPPKEMTSNVRTGQIALTRHIAMYLCRSLLDLPFAQICQAFQKKDHTTVMSACTKVEKMLKTDDNLKKAVNDLKNQLKAV